MSREITIHNHGNNDAKEYNECCLQTDVNGCDMSRTKSELEFAFNDEVDPPSYIELLESFGKETNSLRSDFFLLAYGAKKNLDSGESLKDG